MLLALLALFSAQTLASKFPSLPTNALTPLDEFIQRPDSHYKWNNTGQIAEGFNAAGRWKAYMINMTSQQWLNEQEVDRSIWWHWVVIVVPDKLKQRDFGVVIGTGDSNHEMKPPASNEEYFRCAQFVATHTGIIAAVLYQIPNAPIVFSRDPLKKSRSEDAIIAFGWNVFTELPPNTPRVYDWLTHFPMAKAMVRTMDTLGAFTAQKLNIKMTRFAVAGASKRGWATWLTAAADTRVVAFVPMVLDMLHFHKNLHHMYRAYGGWTWAFGDYYAENFTAKLDDAATQRLLNACDPAMFLDRYANKMKMVIDATADEFFMPDDEKYWWNEFPTPKYFNLIPDAEHSLATGVFDLVPTLSTFLDAYVRTIPLPTWTWAIDPKNGSISATFTGNVSSIVHARMWHAKTCKAEPRRDFRVINADSPCKCGITKSGKCLNLEILWAGVELTPVTKTQTTVTYYSAGPGIPSSGWSAFLIGIEFQVFETNHPYEQNSRVGDFWTQYGRMTLTTQASILPMTFPYPDCAGQNCKGKLV